MAKFCPNCGTQLEDDSVFCTSCGSRVEMPEEPQPQPTYNYSYQPEPADEPEEEKKPIEEPKKDNSSAKTAIALVSVFLVIAIAAVLVFTMFFTPKGIARRYANAYYHGRARQVVSFYPSFVWEDRDEKKDAIDDLKDVLEDLEDEYKKIKIEKVVVHKLSKDERESFEDSMEYLEKMFDDFDADKVKGKNVRKVSIMVSYKDDDNNWLTRVENMYLVKYKGFWKVFTF